MAERFSHETELCFEYETDRKAALVETALGVELDGIADERSRATLERDGPRVQVTIDAEDLVALRAGLNTWLTLLETADRADTIGDVTSERWSAAE